MKECEQIGDLFGKLHDDEADGETGDFVREHLYNCPGCREEYKWYSLTIQALGSLESASPPENFVAQLNSRLYSEPSSTSTLTDFFRNIFSYSPYMPLPVGVASLALVVVLGLAVYNTSYFIAPGAQVATPEPAAHKGIIPPQVGPGGMVAKSTPSGPTIPLAAPPAASFPGSHFRASNPEKTLESRQQFPTIADLIGADNLTVESDSVDKAMESLKNLLPGIQGRLVGEKGHGNPGDVVLAVLIPSDSYGHLTTELIKHGAVASGVGPEDSRLSPTSKDGKNVLLYIRFVSSR
ncbi:MAG: zf-HC2 domain-containing protein [Desulfomonile tiedjei]|uniref:Zf-HC2 domain-containing protein n=1 Tax=Desulfomonile tiedjei TaxID=2358 RepID=A0A9D6V388_9BACT|nr:zf-HC2 domain-containing protein [Desulfomonile tiedjei]